MTVTSQVVAHFNRHGPVPDGFQERLAGSDAQALLHDPDFVRKASAVMNGEASEDTINELLAMARKAGLG